MKNILHENHEKKKIKKFITLVPGFPVLWQAVPAIYRPALCRLEWHFAFFAAI
jgi:hypothetical protein